MFKSIFFSVLQNTLSLLVFGGLSIVSFISMDTMLTPENHTSYVVLMSIAISMFIFSAFSSVELLNLFKQNENKEGR